MSRTEENRQERLAAALRENLKRRKAAVRARETSCGEEGETAPPSPRGDDDKEEDKGEGG